MVPKWLAPLRNSNLWFKVTLACVPRKLTPQDIAMKRALHMSASQLRACLVFQFRGSRKTTVARRVSLRSWLFPVRYLTAENIEGTPESFDAKLGKKVGNMLWDQFLNLLVIGLILLLDQVRKRKEGGIKWKEIAARFWCEFPSVEGMMAIIVLLIVRRPFRRLPTIIDDPIDCFRSLNKEKSPVTATGFLDRLRRLGSQYPVVILSSNEGIERCFSDKAPGLHLVCEFPPPSPELLCKAAHHAAVGEGGHPRLAELTPYHVTRAQMVVPYHYALSIRFWEFLTLNEGLDAAMDPEGPSFSPAILMGLARKLDLQSDASFRAAALGASPLMDSKEKMKLRKLVGCDDLPLPEKLPRRLGMTYALVRSPRCQAACRQGVAQQVELEVEQQLEIKAEQQLRQHLKQLTEMKEKITTRYQSQDHNFGNEKAQTPVQKKEQDQLLNLQEEVLKLQRMSEWHRQRRQQHSQSPADSRAVPLDEVELYMKFVTFVRASLLQCMASNPDVMEDLEKFVQPLLNEVVALIGAAPSKSPHAL